MADAFEAAPEIESLRSRIVVDPETFGGRPRIRGTRARVSDMLAVRVECAEILADYPYISNEDISIALDDAAEALGRKVVQVA